MSIGGRWVNGRLARAARVMCTVAGAAAAFATTGVSAGAGKLPDIHIAYEKFVLPNGLTLIVHEDRKSPIVAVNVWYHVGSKDERPGRTGFAHLFEHLMFNGSEHFDDDYFQALTPVGATKVNGNTWLDRTVYFQNVPTSALERSLWLESDRMGHLLGAIDQKKLDEQRGVVQNEKRQSENRPYGRVDELIAASTYPAGHPYSWPTIGSMDDLNASSIEDVRAWFRTYYGAANAVVVVAGDVDATQVRRRVEHYFGDIPSGPPIQRQEEWIARMADTRRAFLQDRVPQSRIYMTWNVPGIRTPEHVLLNVSADVLASGKNSRLYQRLVQRDQIATEVEASVAPLELGSQFQIVVTVKAGADVKEAERALDSELAAFLRRGPTRTELERVQSVRFAAAVRATERIDGADGKSHLLAESEVLGGSPDFYRTRLNRLREATPAQVKRVAQDWLSDGAFVLRVVPTPDYTVAAVNADRSRLPAVGAPTELRLPALERATLSNGLKVVLAERHATPVVQMSLIIDAGYASDALAGTARIALAMLDEGTRRRDALAIASRAESIGASLGTASTLDTSYVNLNALTMRLEESLELYSDVLLNPTFPGEQFVRLKGQAIAEVQQEMSQPEHIAARLLPKLMYGAGHAYANPGSGSGSVDSVNSLSVADVRAFYRRWMRPDNASLLIVGDTTMAQIRPLLERFLGAWRAPVEALPQKNIAPVQRPERARVFLVHRAGAEQSVILAGHVGAPRSDANHHPLELANSILGGDFISRLNMNLRENKHWSYGVRSGRVSAKGPAPFYILAPVQSDKTAESMQEIANELRDITTTRPPTAAEIERVREGWVRSLPGRYETVSEVARPVADILTYNLPDTYWNDYVTEVAALTPAQIGAAAAQLVHKSALTWIVVGDLAKIEGAVRGLSLGEVSVLDSDGNVLR